MALWSNSTINTTEAAMMFNRLYNYKSVDIVSKMQALLYMIRGKSNLEQDAQGQPKMKWDRRTGGAEITGLKVEWRMLGKLVSWQSWADMTDEIATTDLTSNTQDFWGNATMGIGHFGKPYPVPDSEWQRIKGSEAKTKSYIAEVFDMLMASKEEYMATQLAGSASGGDRTHLGSVNYSVSDGLVASGESANAVYATVDRSDAANVNFRSYVDPAGGNMQLSNLQRAKTKTRLARGKVDLGILAEAQYNKLQALLQGVTIALYDEKMADFGNDYLKLADVCYSLDAYQPDGTVLLLDSSQFAWIEQDADFVESAFVVDPSRNATRVILPNSWEQVINIRPRSHAKLTGFTS